MKKLAFMLAMLWTTGLSAQFRPYLQGTVGINGDYVNPILGASAGFEYDVPRVLVSGHAGYDWSRKSATLMNNKSLGDFGYTISFGGNAFLRYRKLLFGGGVGSSHTVMADAVKGATGPLFGGGFEMHGMRILSGYAPPTDKSNSVHNLWTSVSWRLHDRLRLFLDIDNTWYHATEQPHSKRLWGGEVDFALRYYFRHERRTVQLTQAR